MFLQTLDGDSFHSGSGIKIYGQTSNKLAYSSNTVTISRYMSAAMAGSNDLSGTVRVLATGVSRKSFHRLPLSLGFQMLALGKYTTSTLRTRTVKALKPSHYPFKPVPSDATCANSEAIKTPCLLAETPNFTGSALSQEPPTSFLDCMGRFGSRVELFKQLQVAISLPAVFLATTQIGM